MPEIRWSKAWAFSSWEDPWVITEEIYNGFQRNHSIFAQQMLLKIGVLGKIKSCDLTMFISIASLCTWVRLSHFQLSLAFFWTTRLPDKHIKFSNHTCWVGYQMAIIFFDRLQGYLSTGYQTCSWCLVVWRFLQMDSCVPLRFGTTRARLWEAYPASCLQKIRSQCLCEFPSPNITGWWFQHLWKILVSLEDYSQYMEK